MDCRQNTLTGVLEKIKEWNPLRSLSFTKDYLFAISIILGSISLLSIILIIYQSKVYFEQRQHQLQVETERLEQALIGIFEENRRAMTYIGQQIAVYPSHNFERIAQILKDARSFKPTSMEDDIAPAYFSWANAKGHIVITEHAGILPHPIDLSYRDYFKKCQHFPWMLQINTPDASVFRKTPILPIGLGVADSVGQFRGFIPVGLRVKHLLYLLKKTLMNSETNFVILDQQLNVLLHTGPEKINLSFFKDSTLFNQNQGILVKPLIHQDITYAFYTKMRSYPCLILTGFNQTLANKSFYALVLPQISALLVFTLITILVLYTFQRRISFRIALLTEKASQIAKGKTGLEIPISSLQGIKRLAEELDQIMKCIQKKNLTEQKLLETLASLDESNRAGRKFIQKLSNEWNSSLDFIIKSSEILFHSHKGHIDVGVNLEKQGKLLENLYQSALSLKHLNVDGLKLSDVNLNTLLEESILITSKLAIICHITIKAQFQANLPLLKADPLRLQHIFVSLLCSAIELSPKGGIIKISIALSKDIVSIRVEDEGFGLESQDLRRLNPHLIEGTINWETGYPCLSQEQLEKLVAMQGGHFKVKSQWGKGRVVTLTFPSYAERASVEDLKDKLPSNIYLLPSIALKKYD